jgi:chromosome segregation ATPase
MENEEYTLLSSKEVSELKQDIDYLKKNPLGGSKEGKTLLESIEKLNENIGQLIDIFKEASETMKAEERESEVIAKRIEPIEKKLEELSDQNQKIAKGILAVADMVSAKEEEKVPQSIPRPVAPMMPRPMQMPPPQMQRPMSPPGMPQPMTLPPPPRKEEKKGLFGFKK